MCQKFGFLIQIFQFCFYILFILVEICLNFVQFLIILFSSKSKFAKKSFLQVNWVQFLDILFSF